MNTIHEYDLEKFSNIFLATVHEYNTSLDKEVTNISVLLPKHWEQDKGLIEINVPYTFETEDTLEIKVKWEPEDFIAYAMKAPY